MKKNIINIIKSIAIKALPNNIIIWKGTCRGKKSVALTFDDGPNPDFTYSILDILHVHKIKATFFLVGSNIQNNIDLAMKIKKEGHEIGNHSYTHNNDIKSKLIDPETEIDKTLSIFKELLGIEVHLFRPPYGELSVGLLRQCMKRDLTISMWSVDTRDHEAGSVNELRNKMKSVGIRSNDIILMHDNNKYIVQILPEIISQLMDNEFQFVTVSELI